MVVKDESAERLWRLQLVWKNQGRRGKRGILVPFPVIIILVLINTITQYQLMRHLDDNMGGLQDWFFFLQAFNVAECMRKEGCHYSTIIVFYTVSRMQNIFNLRYEQVSIFIVLCN